MAYVQQDHRRQFDSFARAHRALLLRLARKLCGQGWLDPEDLVQETLERALQDFDKLMNASEAAQWGWLSTTISHRFIDHCRRRRTELLRLPGLRLVQPEAVCLEPEEPAQRWGSLSLEEFRAAVGRLKPRQREAYELHASGLRYREIAERLGTPIGSVGSWISEARKALRELLARSQEEKS